MKGFTTSSQIACLLGEFSSSNLEKTYKFYKPLERGEDEDTNFVSEMSVGVNGKELFQCLSSKDLFLNYILFIVSSFLIAVKDIIW